MKNSVKIKETFAVSVKRYGKVLTLLMALMALSSGAWASTTYYLYGNTTSCNENSVKGWSTPLSSAAGDDSNVTLSLDVSGSAINTDYFVGVNRKSNGFITGQNDWLDHLWVNDISTSGSVSGGNYNVTVDGCSFRLLKYRISSNEVKSITITIKKTNKTESSSCGSTSKWDYTLSAGASPVQVTTWALEGSFNNWSKTENIFVGEPMTTTLSLPANTTYAESDPGAGGTTGFKIAKLVNGEVSAQYGSNNTIVGSCKNYEMFADDSHSHNCGLTTTLGGIYTFSITINGSGNPVLKIDAPTIPPFVPVARFGDKPSENAAKDLTANVYIAAQGCDGSTLQNVSQIRVRFWKEGDDKNAQVITLPESEYEINQNYSITIPSDNELLAGCIEETNIIMEVAALNETGWSDYSDRVGYPYTSSKVFNTHNLSKNFTACDGGHQFALSEMVTPTPDSWTASPAEFSQQGGDIVWNVDGKTQGGTYTFTFEKDGFTSNTATLEITFTGVSTASEITAITTSPSEHITPYTDVTITPTISGGDITSVQWSVQPVASIIANDNNTATFRAKAATTYTVTAVGVTDNCAKTEPFQDTIEVEADSEDCY